MPSATVACCCCGVLWQASDRGVSYRSIDHRWWCTDFLACKARREHARLTVVAAMYRALDAAWESLAKDGWLWPPSS